MTIEMTEAGLSEINTSKAVYTGADMTNSGYSDCTLRITYTAKMDEVQAELQMLFEKQYILTETVETEVRYRLETKTGQRHACDPITGEFLYDRYGYPILDEYEYEEEVPYEYSICTVTLENFDLSHLPVYMMNEEQLSLYAAYMSTLGNRPDLFGTAA